MFLFATEATFVCYRPQAEIIIPSSGRVQARATVEHSFVRIRSANGKRLLKKRNFIMQLTAGWVPSALDSTSILHRRQHTVTKLTHANLSHLPSFYAPKCSRRNSKLTTKNRNQCVGGGVAAAATAHCRNGLSVLSCFFVFFLRLQFNGSTEPKWRTFFPLPFISVTHVNAIASRDGTVCIVVRAGRPCVFFPAAMAKMPATVVAFRSQGTVAPSDGAVNAP